MAASTSPIGPFTDIITLQANIAVSGAGDFDILVDDDGEKAYLAYMIHGRTIIKSRLSS